MKIPELTPEELNKKPKPPLGGFSVFGFTGLAICAALSLVEYAFPKAKWFTFPAMLVAVVVLVAFELYRQALEWRITAHWLGALWRRTEDGEEDREEDVE